MIVVNRPATEAAQVNGAALTKFGAMTLKGCLVRTVTSLALTSSPPMTSSSVHGLTYGQGACARDTPFLKRKPRDILCKHSFNWFESPAVLGKILFENILSISTSTGTQKVIKILLKILFLKKYLKYFSKSKYCPSN